MSREKILAFLNLDVHKPLDKFIMKLLAWSFVFFACLIFFFGFISHNIDTAWYHITVLILSACIIMLSFLSIHFLKNPLWEWFYITAMAFASVLLLLYGWYTNTEPGYQLFTWIHVAALCVFCGLAFYIILKFVWIFRLLKTHTIELARAELLKKTRGWGWTVVPLAGVPTLSYRIWKGSLNAMGLGISFAFWGLACIFLFFFLVSIPRMIIICKYKVYQWFKVPGDAKNGENA